LVRAALVLPFRSRTEAARPTLYFPIIFSSGQYNLYQLLAAHNYSKMSEAKPPFVGQKVFIEEMQLWGEVVELYHDGADLISKVKVLINGKPTVIDVTLLIVQAAELVKTGAVLFGKIKAAVKRICAKLGLCKAKPTAPIVAVETASLLTSMPDKSAHDKAKSLQAKLDKLGQK
jgi:hypothetical protein